MTHEFTISRPVDDVWALLTDLRNVAAAVPGAAVDDAESDGTHHGTLRMRLGAFTATFRGTARYTEVDPAARRVVLVGGGASAQGSATLRLVGRATPSDDGAATHVALDSNVELTGRMAQFGTSMAADVAEQVLDQFVANLTKAFDAPEPTGRPGREAAGDAGSTTARSPEKAARRGDDVLDLGSALMPSVMARVPPPVLGLVLLALGLLIGRASVRRRSQWLLLVDPSDVKRLEVRSGDEPR